MPTIPKHWSYFLAIEADLASCARYVEFNLGNYNCYSNEFAKLIVLAASEVDSIFSELCSLIAPGKNAEKITDYFPILTKKFPLLQKCEVTIPLYKLVIRPWEKWTEDQRPDWWCKSYNKLKHDRHQHFTSATLESALNAISAQFLALQMYHSECRGEPVSVDFSMRSRLFQPQSPAGYKGGAFWGYGDPFAHLAQST